MNALSNVSMLAIPDARTDVHPLSAIAVFCAIVLGASLCVES
jgi:hypothetical protein